MSIPGEETGKEESSVDETGTQDKEALEVEPDWDAENDTEDEALAEEASAEEQLEAALLEVTTFRDVALRAEAEMQNVRRRTERDIENAHKFGIERFLQKLLPVETALRKQLNQLSRMAGMKRIRL